MFKSRIHTRHKAFIQTILKVLVTAGLLFWVFNKIDIQHVVELYKKSNIWYFFLAIFVFFASQILASRRLYDFFEVINLKISIKNNLRLYLLGMFYNLFLPGGIGGDGYKIITLRRNSQVKAKKIFWAIFNDRLSGLVAVGILSVLLFVAVPVNFKFKYYTISLVLLAPLSYIVIIRLFFKDFFSIWNKVLFKSIAIQILQLVSATLLLFSMGIKSNIQGYLMLFLISSLVSIIPFTVGGIGAREMAFVLGAKLIGSKPEICVALSLAFYLVSAIVSLLGLLYIVKPINLKQDILEELYVDSIVTTETSPELES